jgi:hypothetical protein
MTGAGRDRPEVKPAQPDRMWKVSLRRATFGSEVLVVVFSVPALGYLAHCLSGDSGPEIWASVTLCGDLPTP